MPHCSNSLAQQIGSAFGSASETASHQPGGSHSPLLYLVTAAPSPEATLTTEKLKSIVSSVNRLLFSSIYLLRHLGQIFPIKLKSVKHGCLQIFTLVLTTAPLPLSVTLDLTTFFEAWVLPSSLHPQIPLLSWPKLRDFCHHLEQGQPGLSLMMPWVNYLTSLSVYSSPNWKLKYLLWKVATSLGNIMSSALYKFFPQKCVLLFKFPSGNCSFVFNAYKSTSHSAWHTDGTQ